MPQNKEFEELKKKIEETNRKIEQMESEQEEMEENGKEEVEYRTGLKGIILKPEKVAKVVDVEAPDKFESDGITYGVENPLMGQGFPSMMIYNQNDPEPKHYEFDPDKYERINGEPKFSDYSALLMNGAYFENKMEQLSGVHAGGSDMEFFSRLWKWIQSNAVNLMIVVFIALFLVNVPWGMLLDLL